MTAEHSASTQLSQKYILHLKNILLFPLISFPNHMPSLLHLCAFVYIEALFANMANYLFSKPLGQFTPSQQYPGLRLNLFGGGSGPLCTGFSIKRYVKAWQTIYHSIYFSKSAKKISLMLLDLYQVSFKLKGQKYLAVIRCFFSSQYSWLYQSCLVRIIIKHDFDWLKQNQTQNACIVTKANQSNQYVTETRGNQE